MYYCKFTIFLHKILIFRNLLKLQKNPNPEYNYLTIAENGNFPPIFIYKYPKMEIISMLPDGTTKSYTHISYR